MIIRPAPMLAPAPQIQKVPPDVSGTIL